MINYTINTFFLYLGWALGGFALHVFIKIGNAKKTKKDFNFKIFMDKNLFQYLASFVAILLLCGILAISPSQLQELAPVQVMGIILPFQFWLVLMGYTGGSALKNVLKKKES